MNTHTTEQGLKLSAADIHHVADHPDGSSTIYHIDCGRVVSRRYVGKDQYALKELYAANQSVKLSAAQATDAQPAEPSAPTVSE